MKIALPVVLLIISNVFMTFAWYGLLKSHRASPLFWVILASWGIAFFEYCFQVPANRLLKDCDMPIAYLKAIQEIITLVIFAIFSVLFLKEEFRWNYAVGFGFLILAAFFIFWKPAPPVAAEAVEQPEVKQAQDLVTKP
jgi:uncharacterized protein